MRIAAVILAAGSSTRFGSPKQVARFGDATMLEAVVGIARSAGLAPIVVVGRPDAALPAYVVLVTNDAPQLGLSRSLRLGLRALPVDVAAAVILLGDQPTLPAATIAAVLGARGERPIVAASADGLLAPPVLVERSQFGIADGLSGDIGLRQVLTRHPKLVTAVEVEAHAPDVDTPADLAALGRE
jgi:CTP:molybdopterin cytidylyltransferase MocA